MTHEAAPMPVANGLGFLDRSKITVPRCNMVARPRLVARLDEATRAKLTIVSAPAGWGKTGLLTQWARRSDLAIAWVSLDAEDNNPTRFFRYLSLAIDQLAPGIVDDVLTMLRSDEPAATLQLAAALETVAGLPTPTALVLDDYHLIEEESVHAGLAAVLDHLPPTLRLVIASRADLPFPLGRLRAHGEVTEFHADDVRFDLDEATALFAATPGLALGPAEVTTLVERTEGWVAALRLAALSLKNRNGQADPRAVIDGFTGTHRDIADYLGEEVLAGLPPELRAFLVETSILDRLSGALADAVTGRTDGQATLERLAAANLFLLPLDAERRWYRYHRLFADLLRAELARAGGDCARELHRRAARWFDREDLLAEAIRHTLAAGDAPAAVALIDRAAAEAFRTGENRALIQWIEALPKELLSGYPHLLHAYAWALIRTGRLDDAEALTDRIERELGGDGDVSSDERMLRAVAAAIRSRIAAYRGDHAQTIACAEAALALIDDPRHTLRADVALGRGFALSALSDMDAAAAAFAAALRIGWATEHLQAVLWGTRYLGFVRVEQGRLDDAEILIGDNLDRVQREHPAAGAALSALLISRGQLHYERNRLVEARRDIVEGLGLAHRAGDAKILMNGYVARALLEQAEGGAQAAAATVARAVQVFGSPFERGIQAWLALRHGNLGLAQRWAASTGLGGDADDPGGPRQGEIEQIIYGRVLLAGGQTAEGIAHLERLLAVTQGAGRVRRTIEVLALLAIGHNANQERARAIDALERAVDLAAAAGFIRLLVDQGPALAPLLRELLRTEASRPPGQRHRAYIVGLLAALAAEEPSAPDAAPPGLAEPLTERELEVLHLLAAGRSNREIAVELFVAEGTIKAHVHNIYGKLMVRSRTEAIAYAQQLHLLGA